MKKSINCIIFHIYRIIGKFYRLIRNVQSKVAANNISKVYIVFFMVVQF